MPESCSHPKTDNDATLTQNLQKHQIAESQARECALCDDSEILGAIKRAVVRALHDCTGSQVPCVLGQITVLPLL